jgi:hypothetical protein
VNVIFGSPESGKSWLAIYGVIEVVERGGTAAIFDFEDSETIWRDRLLNAGLSTYLLPNISYIRPEEPFDPGALPPDTVDALKVADLVVIDSMNEAMAVQNGPNPVDNRDVLSWRREVTRPLDRLTDAAILLLDHSAMADTPTRTDAIGAIAKRGGVQGVQLKVKPVRPPAPGMEGVIDLYVAKDRYAYVRAVSKEADGDELQFAGRFVIKPQPGRGKRAVKLMVYAPRSISNQPAPEIIARITETFRRTKGPLSANQVCALTKGKRQALLEAVGWMHDEGLLDGEKVGQGVSYRLAELGTSRNSQDSKGGSQGWEP